MSKENYKRLTFKAAIELAAPHTWPASILPVILGAVLSLAFEQSFSPQLFIAVLVIAVLLQSSVNTINDYVDFIKGTDTEENSDDPNDASILYNKINPKTALVLGILFIVAAAAAGVYVIRSTGWIPLVFGGVGVAIIVLYSGGNKSISHLPIGELASGGAMGWLITIAVYYVLGGRINIALIFYALPIVITIGLIMLTNNTCDIERDKESGRYTLPVAIGRKRASMLLKSLAVAAILLVAHIIYWKFRGGLFLIPLMLIHLFISGRSLFMLEFTPNIRQACMIRILSVHKVLISYYIAAIAANLILELI